MVRKKSDTVIAPYPPDRLGVDKMHPGSPDCPVHTSAKKKKRKKCKLQFVYPRSMQEFLRTRLNVSVRSRLNSNLSKKKWLSRRGKDRSTWKKTSWSKGEKQQQTDMVLTLGLEPGSHRWKVSVALTTAPLLFSEIPCCVCR